MVSGDGTPAPAGAEPDHARAASAVAAREPTPEQAAAIAARGGDVLLEAGAGTGKTGVMVDRYCRLVCDAGVSPDAILAFTFTDKAAAELRERIRAELGRRAERGSARAGDLLGSFGGAWVTTIHGFCNRLLAAHPVAAGIDPDFRVLDAPEAARAAREAFDGALAEFLADGDPRREETVAAYELDGLRGMVATAHDELRSRGVAEPRLPPPPEPDVEAALARLREAAAEVLAEADPEDPKCEPVRRAAERLGDGGPPPDLDEVRALAVGKSKPLAAYRAAQEAAVSSVAEAGEGGEAYRHVAELLALYDTRFETAKERRAGIDFEDLQILAARLLERAEIGEAYRSRFKHLLVDEFQDTNRLQLRLIEALHGPRSELVEVGDELQSIYGFRHADLDVFRAQRADIERRDDAQLLVLSGNFRSRPELIGAVNRFGEALLAEAYRPLRAGRAVQEAGDSAGANGENGASVPPSAPSVSAPAVEVLLTARDGWDGEGIELDPAIDGSTPLNCLAEARALAARLRALADSGVPRGSIVVLLRAYTHLDAYEDSLARAGLRPYVVGGRGYWSQQQVADVTALLACVANPLDDEALFGALASPACGAAPDTLWLLRRAAGRKRHVWPALERAVGLGEAELEDPAALEAIPEAELALLATFAAHLAGLRARAPRLALAALIEAATSETGYDLAVLMRAAGESRFANVRKLMRLAEEFEAREGRDLRGLLDFLAARAESDAEAQAATAAEGHDGVRIMTVHNAKGLEFDVVAVPDLSRSLLAGARPPLIQLGREQPPRVGMQLRRLGSAGVNLYGYAELLEESRERDSEEGLRLFHVAATRARERLIVTGVVKPEPARELKASTPVIERLVEALDLPRPVIAEEEPTDGEGDPADGSEVSATCGGGGGGAQAPTPGGVDATVPIPAPEPRAGLDATFAPSELAVRLNLPSPARAAELRELRRDAAAERELGSGPPPLVERDPPVVPSRPLSYTAIAAYEECPYRFYMERVLGIRERVRPLSPTGLQRTNAPLGEEREGTPSAREERSARGAAVHALLEWSQANGWSEPSPELARRHGVAAGLDPDRVDAEDLLGPVRGWLGSALLRERIAAAGATRVRAEVPILLGLGDTVLRGSIDLLVERDGAPPLVVDYKTDRLAGAEPAEHAGRYTTQRSIYALAAAEALGAEEVEVAYVFLERPEQPALSRLDAAAMAAGRADLEAAIGRISGREFPVAPKERRDWALCRGCPALGRLCSGPED